MLWMGYCFPSVCIYIYIEREIFAVEWLLGSWNITIDSHSFSMWLVWVESKEEEETEKVAKHEEIFSVCLHVKAKVGFLKWYKFIWVKYAEVI